MRLSNIGRVWLICGPTASGKSALALRLAEAVGGEIVNADSMQIYADLRVLTARPTPKDEARAPHHLYGVADAGELWSVARWLDAARAALAEIGERGRTAVVVGGSGLYISALTRGLAAIPPIPEQDRDAARRAYEQLGEVAFRTRLNDVDPAGAARILAGDRQRLIRAMEVVQATGRPIGDWLSTSVPTLAEGTYRPVVLQPDRAQLYARCDRRMQAIAANGALAEVGALVARDLSPTLPATKAVGVAEFSAYLRGDLDLEAAIALAAQQTRQYAKRQTTWFRHQAPTWPRLTSLDPQAQWRDLQAMAGLTLGAKLACLRHADQVPIPVGAGPVDPRCGAGDGPQAPAVRGGRL